jgi:hypothetical protein
MMLKTFHNKEYNYECGLFTRTTAREHHHHLRNDSEPFPPHRNAGTDQFERGSPQTSRSISL